MKQTLFAWLCLTAAVANAQAPATSKQQQELLLKNAQLYLSGSTKAYMPDKALAIHLQCAKDGNAQAMNALGIQYSKGLGIAPNQKTALAWFLQAAAKGYVSAYSNLGDIYRNGLEMPIENEKAFAAYSKALELGDNSATYKIAYMQYKGLGCKQNYASAYALFHQAAVNGHHGAMYFAGLCLRNGYGVTRNMQQAQLWLQKAAAHGSQQAKDELASAEPENASVPIVLPAAAANMFIKGLNTSANNYKRIQHNVSMNDVKGTFKGYVIRYDWSGEHIIGVSPLQLAINEAGKTITGTWAEEDSLSVDINASLTDTALVFSDTQIKKKNHYSKATGETWQFVQAHMKLVKTKDSVYMTGNMQLYSAQRKEPGKPMYVILTKQGVTNSSVIAETITSVQTYPNPFGNQVQVQFSLSNTAPVSIQITTIAGKVVYTEAAEILLPGKYQRSIGITNPAGTYLVKVIAGNYSKSVMAIKQ